MSVDKWVSGNALSFLCSHRCDFKFGKLVGTFSLFHFQGQPFPSYYGFLCIRLLSTAPTTPALPCPRLASRDPFRCSSTSLWRISSAGSLIISGFSCCSSGFQLLVSVLFQAPLTTARLLVWSSHITNAMILLSTNLTGSAVLDFFPSTASILNCAGLFSRLFPTVV